MGAYNNKILFVDDEINIVKGLKVQFYKMFSIFTAGGGKEALSLLASKGPFAVVVSDMRMPEMDGVEFLAAVKEKYPDTVRVILTGNADLNSAINAVNEDNIFKFITKPCSRQTMQRVLESALNQYYLVTSEKELLHKTLLSTVKTFMDILSLANPIAFSQADRVKVLAVDIAKQLNFKSILDLELAAMLVQIGTVAVPSSIIQKAYQSEKLTEDEKSIVEHYPEISYSLVSAIPRLDKVAAIIKGVSSRYEDKPKDLVNEDYLFWGAEIIKVALAFDILLYRGISKDEAIAMLRARKGFYSPVVISSLVSVDLSGFVADKDVFRVDVSELVQGMTLEEDIKMGNGNKILLLSKGQKINYVNQRLLENYASKNKISKSILVSVSIYGS